MEQQHASGLDQSTTQSRSEKQVWSRPEITLLPIKDTQSSGDGFFEDQSGRMQS